MIKREEARTEGRGDGVERGRKKKKEQIRSLHPLI